MTSPRKTSTETRRGVCSSGTEGVVSTAATAGELTAVTTSHRYGNESLCHPSFHRNGWNSSPRQTACQQIAIKNSRVGDKGREMITPTGAPSYPRPLREGGIPLGIPDASEGINLTQKNSASKFARSAQAWIALYGFSTIFPNIWLCSMYSWATRTSCSGKVRSTTGFNFPLKTCFSTSCSSPIVPM